MSPDPCWWPPAGICTNVFGLICWTRLSAGVEALARPYNEPVATWVTGRRTEPALTTSVVAACAGAAVRAGARVSAAVSRARRVLFFMGTLRVGGRGWQR